MTAVNRVPRKDMLSTISTAVATGLASHTIFSIIIDFLIKKCKYLCATMKYAINRDSKGHVFLFLDTYDVNLFLDTQFLD